MLGFVARGRAITTAKGADRELIGANYFRFWLLINTASVFAKPAPTPTASFITTTCSRCCCWGFSTPPSAACELWRTPAKSPLRDCLEVERACKSALSDAHACLDPKLLGPVIAMLLMYLHSGRKVSKYAYSLLCMVAGSATLADILSILERREREREVDRRRLVRTPAEKTMR